MIQKKKELNCGRERERALEINADTNGGCGFLFLKVKALLRNKIYIKFFVNKII